MKTFILNLSLAILLTGCANTNWNQVQQGLNQISVSANQREAEQRAYLAQTRPKQTICNNVGGTLNCTTY